MPAPNPANWELLDKHVCSQSYALKVRYPDCRNYEGVKVLVFRGLFKPERQYMDPHFCPTKDSPVARFAPTGEGWLLAVELTKYLSLDFK